MRNSMRSSARMAPPISMCSRCRKTRLRRTRPKLRSSALSRSTTSRFRSLPTRYPCSVCAIPSIFCSSILLYRSLRECSKRRWWGRLKQTSRMWMLDTQMPITHRGLPCRSPLRLLWTFRWMSLLPFSTLLYRSMMRDWLSTHAKSRLRVMLLSFRKSILILLSAPTPSA